MLAVDELNIFIASALLRSRLMTFNIISKTEQASDTLCSRGDDASIVRVMTLMEAVIISETSFNLLETARRNIPEGSRLEHQV
jgi:hypothetical protein